MESIRVEKAMTMVEFLAVTAVGASATLDTTLVLASTSSPSPSLAGRLGDDQHLVDEVVQEFNATHRLSKLSAA
jgi:hypothetical protein